MKPLLITIDGPAGAGKTTVSRALADHLAYTYVDTGALYRAVALAAREAGISLADDEALEALTGRLSLAFAQTGAETRLLLNGADITDRIRTPEISMGASHVSARPVIRAYLLDLQRRLGKGKRVVFEGRDMGTVVFPDADIKFYLHADLTTRAARRFAESRGGAAAQDLHTVKKEMNLRDRQDSGRDIAPLKPADDAVIIDSTALSVEEVVGRILFHIRQKFGEPPGR